MGPAVPRVVLADDVPKSLSIWERLLQRICEVVATAADGSSALEAIRQFKPDVAVLDISMPGLSGLDVARTAITEQPSIGVILCSVMGDPDILEAAANAGVRGYVSKANASHQLGDAVTAVAGGGRFFAPPIPVPYAPKQENKRRLVHADDASDPAYIASQSEMVQALRESEYRLRLALEANSEGVWDWNVPSGKVYFSERYVRILGYESEEFPTDYAGWKELVHPDDFERVNQAQAAHIHEDKEFCVEFRMRKKTGAWCWIRSRAIVIERDAAGNAIRMVGTHADITEHKRAEAALRETEQQLRSALQLAEDRLRFETLLADVSGRFVNLPSTKIDEEIKNSLEFTCKSLGIDHSSIYQVTDDPEAVIITHLFRDVALLQPPERFEAGKFFPWCLKKLLSGEIICLPSTRNAPAEAPVDKVTWEKYQILSTLAIPMMTGGGRLVGIWGFDSTIRERDFPESLQKQLKLLAEVLANAIDRKLTERHLAERETDLREAQRVARVGSWTRDRNDVLTWSDEMYRIHGRDPSLGPPQFEELQRLFAPESWLLVKSARERALQSGTATGEDFEIVRPDGSHGWVATRGEVERDATGQVVRVRGTAQDITERKQVEEKLREYERAIEGVEELIVIVDREYRFVVANRAFLTFYHKTPDCVIGHPIWEIVNKEIFDNVIKKKLETSFRGEPARFEVTFTHPGQDRRTVFATHLPIDGPHGVERVVAILQDISERKKAEEELRDRESGLREAQRIARIGSWRWDPKSDEVTWSDEIFIGTGWDRNTPVPTFREHAQFFTSDSFRKLTEAVQQTLRSGVAYQVETEGTRADGTKGWFINRGEVVYAADGTVDHLRGTVQDITERHLAEVALKESEERFRTIANTAPVMIWMEGPDNRATYVNRQWLEFTGTTIESQLGSGWADCLHPEDADRALREFNDAFERRAAVTVQYRLRRHDGQYRWVIDNAVPRFDANGLFAGYIGSCVDDTERRTGEEALRTLGGRLIQAQEQERRRIARELHDDINQRLALLAVKLQQLRSSPKLSATGRNEYLEMLFRHTEEIASAIQALSHELHSSKLECLGLTAAIDGFCKELSSHHKVAIKYEHHNVPRSLSADISLALFRVTQEALQNAIKYSGVRDFTVRLLGSPDAIHLSVRDKGVGFAPDDSVHRSGLGLISMRERLMPLHGTLSIASKPKHGTEVIARVPLAPQLGGSPEYPSDHAQDPVSAAS